MRKRLAAIVAIALSIAGSTVPSSAEQLAIGPPFLRAGGYRTCSGLPPTPCAASVRTDRLTGSLSLRAASVTSLHGAGPGLAETAAYASFLGATTLAAPTESFSATVTLHIDRAALQRSGPVGDTLNLPRGYAETRLWITIWSDECFCTGSEALLLAGTDGERSVVIEDQIVELTVEMVNLDGGAITPGRVEVYVDVVAYARANGFLVAPVPDPGRASAEIDATVTSVTAHTS